MAKNAVKGFENAKNFESGAKNAPVKANEQQKGRFADPNGNFYASEEAYKTLMAQKIKESMGRH